MLTRLRPRVRSALRPAVTHVVPLGLSCRVTHQARVCFGVGEAYPFDWWLSPLAGLIRYLEVRDPSRLYHADALEERIVDQRVESIRSKEFGCELYHEFPRHRVNGASAVAPGWRQHIPEARQRHARRLERLHRLDRPENRVLFLRHKYSVVPEESAPVREITALRNVLHSVWSWATVDLLLLNVPLDGPLPRGVLSVGFEDPPGPPPDEWRGETSRWQTAFGSLGLHVHPSAARASSSAPVSTGPPD